MSGPAWSDAEVVARCPLFAGLPDDAVRAVAAVARRRPMRAGETLFLAGEPARGLPLVVRGAVKVSVVSPASGREVVLAVERPFQAVAELVAFDGGRYPAGAEALEDGELLWIDRRGFEELLERRPGLARHLLGTLGRRLRRLVALIEQLSFQEVVHRLAGDLLRTTSEGVPATLESNAVIAARIGTVPELVSRNLARLHHGGAIRLEGRSVTAVDLEALRELATRTRR